MKDKRRTRWTDSNGNLKDAYRGAWELQQIEAAGSAGIPEHWLLANGSESPAGSTEWRERGQLDGAWTDILYGLSCCLRGVDYQERERRRNLPIVLAHLGLMTELSGLRDIAADATIEGVSVIPWDVYVLRLRMYGLKGWRMPPEHSEYLSALNSKSLDAITEALDACNWANVG